MRVPFLCTTAFAAGSVFLAIDLLLEPRFRDEKSLPGAGD